MSWEIPIQNTTAFSDRVAGCALRSLLYEVCISPKPGLVDRHNNGAHQDMDVFTFLDSVAVLAPYFRKLTRFCVEFEGDPGGLLSQLRSLGIQAEKAMLRATGGVNTHKGLIFSLGIVCAAFGILAGRGQEPTPDGLLDLCARIAGQVPEELAAPGADGATAGREAYRRYGVSGVRGEAAAGFPSVRKWGYPALKRAMERGGSLNDAGVAALLCLMAHVEDTNVLKRAGMDALRSLQERVRGELAGDPSPQQLLDLAARLDEDCIRDNISPGGCADLLALSFMVYFLFRE